MCGIGMLEYICNIIRMLMCVGRKLGWCIGWKLNIEIYFLKFCVVGGRLKVVFGGECFKFWCIFYGVWRVEVLFVVILFNLVYVFFILCVIKVFK